MPVNRRQLRARSRRVLRELDLRPPLDLESLRHGLAERRRRPILLAANPDLGGCGTFGFTWDDSVGGVTVIMYEANTTRTHQTMIILHELAHLILEHRGCAIDRLYGVEPEQEFRTISPHAVADVLGARPPLTRQRLGARRAAPFVNCTFYDDTVEWEAETMATVMAAWVSGWDGHTAAPTADPLQALLGENAAW